MSISVLACCWVLMCSSGCHRGYYRRQADHDAQRLIRQKSCDPRWNNSADGTIVIDPQSRMFDPFSSDHPPIPPDDPASHSLMHCVDGHRGYPHWHANGDTNYVENPEWKSYLPVNEQGQVVLDLESAYRMALLHSPDLQQQRETLYLSALDVSLERFGFDSQLFSGFNNFLTHQGSDLGGGPILSSALGNNSQGINWNKLGITGTNFAVGLANSIMWNFAGSPTRTANSLIDFSIIQPLLRNAGRDRILEALTQSERTLLANVRQLDRFRRGFYLNVTTGRNTGAGPGTNFLGFPVGFGGTGGVIGLLEQQQQIRIQEFNVRQLENVLEQFREFFRRERIDSLQVRQFEQTLYAQQNTLLQLKTGYQTSLDNFKQTLGLPPSVEIVIEDPLLDQFEFISDDIAGRQIAINRLRSSTGSKLNLVDELCPLSVDGAREPEFTWPDELQERIADLLPYIEQAEQLIEELEQDDRQQVESDLNRLEKIRPQRVDYLAELRNAIDRGEILADVEPAILQPESLLTPEELQQQLAGVSQGLQNVKERIGAIRSLIENFDDELSNSTNEEIYKIVREKIGTETSEQLSRLYKVALEMSLVQAQSRANSIGLAEVDLNDGFAFQIARCFRRDLMNARAALVDQWRLIEFFADDLESELDLVFEGSIGGNGEDPFSFRTANGQISGGFRFDAPIVRMTERNSYREALISYQQARRSFYQFEDEIHANLRQILRELNLNKILFELSRQNVQVAVEQVELAQLRLEDPRSTSLGATTARDLTQAISGLQTAQNQFLGVWVEFEVLRRSLDFDLGTFQLGPDTNWIDPGAIDQSIAERAAAMMGVSLEDQCYCNLLNFVDPQDPNDPAFTIPEANTYNSPADDQQSQHEQEDQFETQRLPPQLPEDTSRRTLETLVPESANEQGFVELPPQPDFESPRN